MCTIYNRFEPLVFQRSHGKNSKGSASSPRSHGLLASILGFSSACWQCTGLGVVSSSAEVCAVVHEWEERLSERRRRSQCCLTALARGERAPPRTTQRYILPARAGRW